MVRVRSVRAVALAIAAHAATAGLFGNALKAQSTQDIRECARPCPAIEFRTLHRVGGNPDDTVLLRLQSVPVRLASGGYVAGMTADRGVIAVYDSMGALVRTLGHLGGGPGEFRQPQAFPGPVGQTWIVDPGNARITVLDEGGRPTNAFRYSGRVFYTAPIDSNRVVVSGPLQAGGGVSSFALHVLDSGGRIVKSFAPWPPDRKNRRVTMTPQGTVMASYEERYVVEEWSLDGELIRTMARHLDWFPPGSKPGFGGAGLENVAVDPQGRLWAVLLRPEFGAPADRGNTPIPGMGALNERWDAIVEVIDVRTLQVVARGERDIPYLFPTMPFDGDYRSPAQDTLGYVSYLILKAVSAP